MHPNHLCRRQLEFHPLDSCHIFPLINSVRLYGGNVASHNHAPAVHLQTFNSVIRTVWSCTDERVYVCCQDTKKCVKCWERAVLLILENNVMLSLNCMMVAAENLQGPLSEQKTLQKMVKSFNNSRIMIGSIKLQIIWGFCNLICKYVSNFSQPMIV